MGIAWEIGRHCVFTYIVSQSNSSTNSIKSKRLVDRSDSDWNRCKHTFAQDKAGGWLIDADHPQAPDGLILRGPTTGRGGRSAGHFRPAAHRCHDHDHDHDLLNEGCPRVRSSSSHSSISPRERPDSRAPLKRRFC